MRRQAPGATRQPSDRAIYLLLFAATLIVYGQVHNFAFLSFDDTQGLLNNPQVRDGFSGGGIVWAFTTGYASNWFPLTWFSHMLDFQLFGMDAGWHHLVNVLIHAVSSVLLFALLKRMTGAKWESAFVAFVFALHPLHVESVAWISERKDVLFAFFWFLTTWLYLDFLEKRTVAKYLLVVAAFCLGLMSKQMIVTLPFALLLLDFWPLKRAGLKTLILEKTPLVALSLAASAIAFLAQRRGGAVQTLEAIPLAARAANALMAYVIYVANFFWPTGLAFFYPYPARWPMGEVAFAAAALAAMSVSVVLAFRKRPYLAVGWFWFLGTLAPVIGIIQVGHQSRADRYTYVPLIGISIMMARAAAEAFEKWPRARQVLAGVAIVSCAWWALVTWLQIPYWKDSAALYTRAIAVTEGNYLAHLNLGVDMAAEGHYPDQPHARNSLGGVLFTMGRRDEALEQFTQAIRLEPGNAEAHGNFGNALVEVGRIDDAIRELNTALKLNPGMATAYYGLGRVLVMQGRANDAATYFNEALRINPGFAAARAELEKIGK
jgi:protein O-mannosyl-transferase